MGSLYEFVIGIHVACSNHVVLYFQVGKFDPLTRAPLYPNQVVPNLALKEAVQAYLKEHGWAYN